MSSKPNFIFFITDQHRADWLGCYGHPVVKTPHIDALAANGTRFDNFHVASPVCMPNRASLLTGRYPTQHGLRYNGCTLSLRANTFVDVLCAAGYQTATIGKSHLQPFTDILPLNRSPDRGELIKEAWQEEMGDYGQEEPGRYSEDGRYSFKTPYYGYQHVDMVTSHGVDCGGHYHQWFREQAEDWQALQDQKNELPHNYSCPQAYRTPVPEELYSTSYIKNQAVDYLQSSVSDDQPFFLFVSFPDPHHPFNPPGKYWDMYSPDQFEVGLPYGGHKNPTPPMKWLYDKWQSDSETPTPQTAFMTDEEKLRQAMALTAGMISMVDDAVGDVMEALRSSGHASNTVVCFNSDHGDYLGDYNLLLKGALPFRSITRVPFIWADPQISQKSSSAALSSTIDLSATILDRAGVQPYVGMHGTSLLQSAEKEVAHRNALLIEYNDGMARLGFDAPARVRSLLTSTHRLSIYMDQDWGELYDLIRDPNESNNLWDDPESQSIRATLSLSLNHELTRLMDESPRSKRLA
ncbi:MAG: sulfatase family protein [bacterium]